MSLIASAHSRATRGSSAGNLGQLVQQVDDLFDPADKVARGQVRAAEDVLQVPALGPLVHRPDQAQFGFTGQRELVGFLHVLQGGPFTHHNVDGGFQRDARHLGPEPAVLALGLVDQDAGEGGDFGGVQVAEGAQPQGLRNQQVLFAVDPAQPLPVRADGEHSGVGGFQVAVAGQDAADPVEGLGDGVGPALDLADQPVRLLAELPPALGPAGVVLTFAAAMAGVGAELAAQLRDPLFLVRQGRGAAEVVVPARRRRRAGSPAGRSGPRTPGPAVTWAPWR